jgi:hypothetical protein
MKNPCLIIAALWAATLWSGCHHHGRFDTPAHFAKLAESKRYEQRATSPEGIVIAVRKLELAEPASLSFWSDAIVQRLRGGQGYALLQTRDVKAKTGHAGKLLSFGRDQNGHTFDYWVAVFPHRNELYLLEAGGRRDRFERAQPQVQAALASLQIR